MSFYRALTRNLVANYAHQRAVVPWYQQEQKLSALEMWWKENMYPLWFRFVKGPYERYYYEREVADLRGYGLMYDDMFNCNDPLIERALEILPHDLAVGRYRRMMRAVEMSCKKMHLPVEEQNYDPMIPYMAPFVEEAKFQMQEEQELLAYHPWDRRLYSAGVTGFGETTMHSTFSTW
mmetsp:Transcript_12393/g.29144  ORF Transcript_12393/g.29144 Transcript_12393/m.29144 type:complete len:178 (+) Transcript_12393:90-623(+)|eukprot:CAMPEP_0178414366 /NCGR_PEP_ID=MMETSP0689_2-20121128/22999_1 /TAXON_ID=160604 /ORGANISM="Amphidinium massartii, Strain CS-259" /LENGTH=177 /DNA_ID=CAMNT_0020035653 /DNA_START=95 /DNA_END=628 /DNA_ORIENTATION=+